MYTCALSAIARIILVILSTSTASPLTNIQAQGLLNETFDLTQQALNGTHVSLPASFNGSLLLTQDVPDANTTTIENPLNRSVTASENFIPYRIPHSAVTILFHGLDPEIGLEAVLQTITGAISIAIAHIADMEGNEPILNGYFSYTHSFPKMMQVTFAIGDFRELGRPMTYTVLAELLRGIGDFMMLPGQKYTDARFEVEQTGRGYIGSGYIEQTVASAARPTLTTRPQ